MTTDSKAKAKKTHGKVYRTCQWTLIGVFVIFALYLIFCNVTGRIAFVGKYAVVRIISPSMEPTIPTGKYILIEKTSSDDINVQDIIIFISRDKQIYGAYNTHRVVKIENINGDILYHTKGDNNPVEDSLATKYEDVRGKYVKNAPVVTKIADFFSNKIVFMLCILVPSFIFLIWGMLDVIKKSKEVKKEQLIQDEVERLKREGFSPETKESNISENDENNEDNQNK